MMHRGHPVLPIFRTALSCFQGGKPIFLAHQSNLHTRSLELHRLLNLCAKGPMFPFGAAEAPYYQIVEFLGNARLHFTAERCDSGLAPVTWAASKIACQAECSPVVGDRRHLVRDELRDVR